MDSAPKKRPWFLIDHGPYDGNKKAVEIPRGSPRPCVLSMKDQRRTNPSLVDHHHQF